MPGTTGSATSAKKEIAPKPAPGAVFGAILDPRARRMGPDSGRTTSTEWDTRARLHGWQLPGVHRGVGSLLRVAQKARSMELEASDRTPRPPTRRGRPWQSRRSP